MVQYTVFYIISVTFVFASVYCNDVLSNQLYLPYSVQRARPGDLYLMQDKLRYMQALQPKEKVKVQLYYESLCPDCRIFDVKQFAPTITKLSEHLDIHVYPYGNARTIVYNDGKIEINCQHGPAECYGNMLHACAIDNIGNLTIAINFNSCMMEQTQDGQGSDDAAADKCGVRMGINTLPIKACANSMRGFQLLKAYGEESKKVGFRYVPYILINGQVNDGSNFMHDVCAAFKYPPAECRELV